MSKIVRYQGDVRAFASDAQGMERTVFGGTNQADDLTSQITASFLRGWGIVGASEHPSLEDFNAAMYAMSQFIAYQHQMGVPEWHAEQEYHIGSICTHNGESYQSLQNANIGSQPPSAKWTPVLTSKNGLANLGLGEAARRNVGTGENQIPDMASFSGVRDYYGKQLLPGGLILQWLTIPSSAAAKAVTLNNGNYQLSGYKWPQSFDVLFAVFATKVSGSTNEAYAISVNRHSTDVIVTWNARKADDVHILGIGKL